VVLEGFLRFPETTQDFPPKMGTPLFSYNVSRGIHSQLNSGVTGFCFNSKLRKYSEDLFFGHHEGKLETFAKICVAASLETLREDPTVRALQKSATKLLSEISRTTPAYNSITCTCTLLILLKFCLILFRLYSMLSPFSARRGFFKTNLFRLYSVPALKVYSNMCCSLMIM